MTVDKVSRLLCVVSLVFTALLASAGATASTPVATPVASPLADDALFAWIQLGPGGSVLARAITAQSACPGIRVDGSDATMMRRARFSNQFPVTVCEAALPAAATSVTVLDKNLTMPTSTPKRIAVIGDTGCRLNAYDGFQACNDPAAWPFATIAQQVATWKPDLIIHVGDYLYREQACPAGNTGCAGSPYGDSWATWRADFFDPAAPLLSAAPWVFLRGNHEVCSRAGTGWFRLLDPRPWPGACQEFTEPYPIPFTNTQLIVIDSANAGDEQTSAAETAAYQQQFDVVASLATTDSWLVSHKPAWGVIENSAESQIEVNTDTFEAATEDKLPANIDLVISGHIHLAELFVFASASERPTQLIVGNSGTALDKNVTATLDGQALDDAALETGKTLEQFGFLTLESTSDGWIATEHGQDGTQGSTCTLRAKRATCDF